MSRKDHEHKIISLVGLGFSLCARCAFRTHYSVAVRVNCPRTDLCFLIEDGSQPPAESIALMELRRHPRVHVKLPVMFFGSYIQGTGCVTTLSHGGCTITSQVVVAPGVSLKLQLTLPEHEAPLEMTTATVQWAVGDQLGVRFRMAPWDAQERLHQFLSNRQRTNEVTPPTP